MKCVTIHLSLHNEVLERGELSPAGTVQRGHGHSGDQEGGWQHKNMLSRLVVTYMQLNVSIIYPSIFVENQDVKFLLVLCSCLAPPAMFQTEAGQILSDRLCVQRTQSPVSSGQSSSVILALAGAN